MATGLATRCTACGTIFRVVPDQLRVSEGWVRCGRCTEVFNASAALIDLDSGHALVASDPPAPPPAPPPPAPTPPRQTAAPAPPFAPFAPLSPVPAPPPRAAAFMPLQRPAAPASDPGTPAKPPPAPAPRGARPEPIEPRWGMPQADDEPSSDLPVVDEAASRFTAVDAADLPMPAGPPPALPSFVRRAERARRWRKPQVRAALAVLAVLGAVGLALQVLLEYRDVVAARQPGLRPLLEAACAPLACRVEAARSIDGLTVESSGLVRVEKSTIYKLTVALRNRSGMELTLPALELSLNDAQGKLVARRVLNAPELGVNQTTLAAGRELALQATLQAATPPVAGYTIELFYP